MAAGADLQAPQRDGLVLHRITPLFAAVAAGQAVAAPELIAAGACVECRGGEGEAPLHVAANAGEEDVVAVLLAAGAAVDAKMPTMKHRCTGLQSGVSMECWRCCWRRVLI